MRSATRRWAALSAAAAVAVGMVAGVRTASAATLDWDITPGTVGAGNGTVEGGTGTWDTTNGNWTANTGTTNVAWVNANNDIARFGAPGGTVTLGTGIQANGLTFNTTGYTVTGNTLTLAGATPTITVTNAADTATVASVIAGTSGFTLAGAGKLVNNTASTFTGDVTLSGGTLETNMAGGAATSPLGGQIGTTYRQLIFGNNATLRTTASWNDNTPTATNVGIVFNFAGAGTLDVSAGTLTIDDGAGAGTATANAQLQGSGTLTKIGVGTLSLGNGTSDFASFTGAIVVGAGTLNVGTGSNQLGTTAAGTTVQSGAVLNVNAITVAEPLTISGTGLASAPAGALIGSGGTVSGTVAFAADASVGGAGNLTLSGVVSGGFNLTKVGAGATILTAANTYAGNTTVGGGALRAVFGAGLPNTTNLNLNGGAFEPTANFAGTLGTAAGQVQLPGGTSGFSSGLAAGVTVNLNAGATLVWGTTAGFNPAALVVNQTTALGTLDFQNPIDLNGVSRTFAGNSGSFVGTVSGVISNSSATAVGPTINGSGVVAFSGANTFTGATTLTAGTLQVATDANLGPNGTPISFNGGTLRVTGTAIPNFANHPATFVAGKTIGIDVATAAHTFTVSQALVAGQTLTKAGAGTLALTAASNTVTTLNMNGGTLDLGGGTLNLSNAGSTTIRGTANSTINNGTIVLSTGAGTDFADNSVAGVTLTINAKVSGTSTTAGFEYCCDNSGTIVLANAANDFQGNVFINSTGTIATPAVGNQSPAAGNLGRGTTVNLNSGGRLQYTGAGETTNRIINLSGTTAGGILDQSGTGLLKFTADLTATGAGAKTLTLQGSTAGTGEFAGAIVNSTAATGVTKAGTGTWTLSGTNTYTGTTTLAGGVLAVSAAANLGAAAAPVTFNGGTLRVTGTALNNLTGRTVTFTNNVAAGIDVADPANTFTLPGAVSIGTGDFTKAGPGTLVMTGANAVRTLNMNGGTLDIGAGTLALNNSGGNTIRGTADSTINATGGGSITISTAGGTNYGDNSVSAGVTLTINAKLTSPAGGQGFEYCCDNPGGTIVLNNTGNDYAGDTFINSPGTISVPAIGPAAAAASPLGKGTNIFLQSAGARLLYTGPGESTSKVLSPSANATVEQGGAGLLRFTANLAANGTGARTLTLAGSTGGTGEFAGTIGNNGTGVTSIAKAGTGIWALSGANTLTGTTTVTAGTLLANNTTGSATGTGAVTVSTAGTLGGSGVVTGPVSITSGGTLSPGNSPGILGTGNLTMASGSTLREELGGTTAGTGYDQVNVTGTVSLGNATLTLVELARPNVGDQFVIVNNDSTDAVTGTFAGLADEAIVNGPFNQYRISYDGPTSGDNDVVLTALTSNPVPEPASAGLLGLAAVGLLARRRRRQASGRA